MVDGAEDCDLYDVFAELGCSMAPRTRVEWADAHCYKHQQWLGAQASETAETVRALTGQFARGSTEGLENRHIFQTPEVRASGGLQALKQADNPAQLLRETQQRMFAA
ncbi:MAG: hypothetical protein K6T86_14805 [Pirellulales bacterium]|nr:hypothetical protein [Pirellulales bacterium]